jgi:hypothetical protein
MLQTILKKLPQDTFFSGKRDEKQLPLPGFSSERLAKWM